MTQHSTIQSRAYLLPAGDIDTDQVFPSRFQNRVHGVTDLSPYFFHDQRFDAEGQPLPGAPLNDPDLRGASILVSLRNYACGSARPGAIFAHRDFGIRVLISESFGQVFPTVCYKFGVVPVELPAEAMATLIGWLNADPHALIEIDFAAQEIRAGGGLVLPFELDAHVQSIALSGQDEFSLTRAHQGDIERYESERARAFPWLMAAPVMQEPQG